MARLDEFSPKVKKQLRDRAGDRCSICEKSTTGPTSDGEGSRSDGIAAHITAAGQKGPRRNDGLTPEERSSYWNGIWCCSRCGREIDADRSAYSEQTLRGLKRIREARAWEENKGGHHSGDSSTLLFDLPDVTNDLELFEIISDQPHTSQTANELRRQLSEVPNQASILDMASEIVLRSEWDVHADGYATASILLSTNHELWRPTRQVQDEVERRLVRVVADNRWDLIHIAEPVAFALSMNGKPGIHAELLLRHVEDPNWRDSDEKRNKKYYGHRGVRLAAIDRHYWDPHRTGIPRANDLPRLIHMLQRGPSYLGSKGAWNTALGLLGKNVETLRECGEVGRPLCNIAEQVYQACCTRVA